MASPSALVHRPELDNFLFAAIGEEQSGMMLTVASALGRLGFDPWAEADRFAEMSKTVAAEMLAPMIVRLPQSLWTLAEAQVIATRLVKLLPQRQPVAALGHTFASAQKPVSIVTWMFCAALVVVFLAMAAGADLSIARFFGSSPVAISGEPPLRDR
jgi:hypothetical protein